MASCLTRSVPSFSPLHRSSLRNHCKPNIKSPYYLHKLTKFTNRVLLRQKNQLCCSSSSTATASSSSIYMDVPTEYYRRNVGICVINSDKKIFAAARLDAPDSWQMPQGGIDDNEDPKIAALRELKEETGISSVEVLAEVPQWLKYDFPPDVMEKIKVHWGGYWKGQAQKWFLVKFTGKDEEVNLLGDGSEKPEFVDWKWTSPEEILERIVDFKKPVYKEVFTVFSPYLQ